MKFDLIIRNALVVDPLSRTAEVADVAVHNGRIECVCPELSADGTHEIDAKGLVLQPGVIDSHLHLSVDPRSHSMVARAGVTTAVDMSGPTDAILEQAREHGRGLNIAVLNAVLPGRNVSGNSPDEAELDRFMDASLAAGAFGVKLLGGHFPLTPDSSACMVRKADEKNVYMAWHAGTTEKGSDITGLEEAVALCDGHPLHLAHLNAYCRGRVADVLEECRRAAALLEKHPEIVTESYLSSRNGCPFDFNDDGTPKSKIAVRNLELFGYRADKHGACDAIRSGRLSVLVPEADDVKLLSGEAGAEYFLEAVNAGRHVDGSFAGVNPFLSRHFFLTAKRVDGSFLTDAISTDGGGLPRNVILGDGLSFVRLGELSAVDFARKTSLLPALMLGFTEKGTLLPGADADITVYDPMTQRAVHTFAMGRPLLLEGKLAGAGATVICTPAGQEAVARAGLEAYVVKGGFHALNRLG